MIIRLTGTGEVLHPPGMLAVHDACIDGLQPVLKKPIHFSHHAWCMGIGAPAEDGNLRVPPASAQACTVIFNRYASATLNLIWYCTMQRNLFRACSPAINRWQQRCQQGGTQRVCPRMCMPTHVYVYSMPTYARTVGSMYSWLQDAHLEPLASTALSWAP
jgi:hypothetical protein